MLKGLEIFAERFAAFSDSYIVIGGTACYLNLRDAGLEFRATKDIDIVLSIEALRPGFFTAFWDFVHEGRYEIRHRHDRKPVFYRFAKPDNPDFPAMLELFSRTPASMDFTPGDLLTPLPAGDDASSLSAILLDEEYYAFLHEGVVSLQGISAARPDYLIPLKAKAWLDLSERKARGEPVDSRNIAKHLKDIAALFSLLVPAATLSLPLNIEADLARFLDEASRSESAVQRIAAGMREYYSLKNKEA